jgi:hypothetical protein
MQEHPWPAKARASNVQVIRIFFTANIFTYTMEDDWLIVLSIQIQNQENIGPRLLVAQDSTCLVSTSTSTTSTTSRPINFTMMVGDKKT